MPNSYDTLESAQARILELEQQLESVTNERDTLSENNNTLNQRVTQLSERCQDFFNQIIQQRENPGKDEEEDEEGPTLEEFTNSLIDKF